MDADWIRLDQEALNPSEPENFRGTQIEVRLSPYDVPDAMRSAWLVPNRVFQIQFRYLGGEEPTIVQQVTEAIKLSVGRHSQRVYQIEINMAKFTSSPIEHQQMRVQIIAEVNQAIETLGREPSGMRSYRAVTSALQGHTELVP